MTEKKEIFHQNYESDFCLPFQFESRNGVDYPNLRGITKEVVHDCNTEPREILSSSAEEGVRIAQLYPKLQQRLFLFKKKPNL